MCIGMVGGWIATRPNILRAVLDTFGSRAPGDIPRSDRKTVSPPELGIQCIRETVQHIGVVGETEFLHQTLSSQSLFLRMFVLA